MLKAPPRDAPGSKPSPSRRPSDATYRKVVKGYASEMDGLINAMRDLHISPSAWADEFDNLLYRAHTDAFVLGRQRAGDLTAQQVEDQIFGIGAKDVQSEFLRGFLDDLEAGDSRYFSADGTLKAQAVANRGRLYLARLRGTANEAFVESGEDDDEYDWVLGATEHCPDCIELAGLSPFTKDTTLGHPGEGLTECKSNCHCRWKRRRGNLYGFDRVDVYGGYDVNATRPDSTPSLYTASSDASTEPVLVLSGQAS